MKINRNWSPKAHPYEDPGKVPEPIRDRSFLYYGNEVFLLDIPRDRKLGQSTILFDSSRKKFKFPRDRERLNNHLVRNQIVSVDARYPIVVYGTLRNPAHLSISYLENFGNSDVIPFIKARMKGVEKVFAPFLTADGVIPYALLFPTRDMDVQRLAHLAQNEIDVYVMLVDHYQLDILVREHSIKDEYSNVTRLAETVEGDYSLREVDGSKFSLTLENNERLNSFYIFYSQRGVLARDPMIPSESSIDAVREDYIRGVTNFYLNKYRNSEQSDHIFDNISAEDLFKRLLGNDSTSKTARANFSRWLQQTHTYRGNLVFELPIVSNLEDKRHLFRYGDPNLSIWPDFAPIARPPGQMLARKNYRRKPGDYAVRFSAIQAKQDEFGLRNSYRNNEYVAVQYPINDDTSSPRVTLALWQPGDLLRPAPRSTQEVVLNIDKTLRTAIGIVEDEPVKVLRVKSSRRSLVTRLLDFMIPRNYFIFRTQIADVTLDEKASCALSQIALNMMGIQEGDYIVLEGLRSISNDPQGYSYEIGSAVAKVYVSPPDMVSQRETIQRSVADPQHPDCSEMLGVYPDLPWIFVDEDIVKRSGLNIDPCSPIRVRVMRRHQVVKNISGIAALISLGLLGNGVLLQLGETDRVLNPLNFVVFFIFVMGAMIINVISLRGRIGPADTHQSTGREA